VILPSDSRTLIPTAIGSNDSTWKVYALPSGDHASAETSPLFPAAETDPEAVSKTKSAYPPESCLERRIDSPFGEYEIVVGVQSRPGRIAQLAGIPVSMLA